MKHSTKKWWASLLIAMMVMSILPAVYGSNEGGETPTADTTPPDITVAWASPDTFVEYSLESGSIYVEANASDVGLGDSVIVDVRCILYPEANSAPTGFFGTPMTPTDGAYDEIEETVYAYVDASWYDAGNYKLWIAAKDSNDNYPSPWEDYVPITILPDTTPPEITWTAPQDGEIDVALDQAIYVYFSEAIQDWSVQYTITPDPGGVWHTWTNSNGPSGYNDTLIIYHDNFALDTWYEVNITQAQDLAGNYLVPGSVPNPWIFLTVSGGDTEGPMTYNVLADGVNPLTVTEGTPSVQLMATVNDTTTGNSIIAAAEYFIDVIGMDGTGTPMNAADGMFDMEIEEVGATVDTSGWAVGTYTLYVHGQDVPGNWGAHDSVVITVEAGPVNNPPGAPTITSIELTGAGYGDITITWAASADDGAGENDVIEYDIYKDVNGGGYVYYDSVAAAALASYSWTDLGAGDGDSNLYKYKVYADDGAYTTPAHPVGKYIHSLELGWNLISIPLVQYDTSLSAVLKTIDGNYESVQGYDNQGKEWKTFHSFKPGHMNDLTEVHHKIGVWIEMTAADTLVTVGKVCPSDVAAERDIQLFTGWNLIGYPTFTDSLIGDALSGLGVNYKVKGYANSTTSADHLVMLSDSDLFETGHGYWIHVDSNTVWTVDW